MNRGRKWLKITFWIAGVLLIVAAGLSAMSLIMLRRTPEWYQPDTITAIQRHRAAGAFGKLLVEIHNWGSDRHAADVRAAQSTTTTTDEAARSREILASKPDQAFKISFTDTELNAFFNEWAETGGRREWLDQYVEDPRLVMRENQLIVVGKAKDMGLIVSLLFAPRLRENGQLDLNLTQVLGGVLPLPDAMWSNQRDAVERNLRRRLPQYQRAATVTPQGVANADAGAALMNELLLATMKYKPTAPVVVVPIDLKGLSESLPVKITQLAIHDHEVELTVQQMNDSERQAFLQQLKSPQN